MMDAGVYIPMRGKPRTLERTILTDGRRERRMVGGEEGDGGRLRQKEGYLRNFAVWRERFELHK